jgi:ribosome-binding protein aMBF1 (putative translation factor)
MKVFAVLLAACLAFGIYTTTGSTDANTSRANTQVSVNRSFAEQVHLARLKKGLTTKQLADKIGLSLASLEQVERGQLLPNDEVVSSLENVLGTRLDTTAR